IYDVGDNKLEKKIEAIRSKPVNTEILEKINSITEDNKNKHLAIKYEIFLDLVQMAANQGKIPAFSMTLGGKPKLRWARPQNFYPRLFFIETYRLTNFPGDYGPGRLIKTFSLLPGEQSEITIKTWKKSASSIRDASSILDSYTEEKADEFESNLQREFSNTVTQEESDTFNANASVKATWGAGVDGKDKKGKKLDAGAKISAEGNVSYEKTRKTSQEVMIKALTNTTTKHALKASSKREVNIETNYERTEDEGEEIAITRKIENLNVSRTLNFTFRQMNQQFHSLIHLTDLTVAFFNGYPGSMQEYELSEIGDLVQEFVINPDEFPLELSEDDPEGSLNYDDANKIYTMALDYLIELILDQYGEEKLIDYQGTPKTFVKVEEESRLVPGDATPRIYKHLRVLNASDNDGFSEYEIRKNPRDVRNVNGIILGTNVVSMRTDGVVVEALLGEANALDNFALNARNEKIRQQNIDNEIRRVEYQKIQVGIDLVSTLIEEGKINQAAEVYKTIFSLTEGLKTISEVIGPQAIQLERKLTNI
ncbi:MAG: hypothetical protein ACFFDF_25620, partial [Candidatus Odinarchaeota archaeon]